MRYMICSGVDRSAASSTRSLSHRRNARGLVGEAQAEQRVDRERRVADPGEAVVPVALAADLLGQPRGRRRDQRAGRRVRHQLQRHRRAFDHLPPPSRVAGPADPAAPEVAGLLEQLQRSRRAATDARRPIGRGLEHQRRRRRRRRGSAKARTPCSVRCDVLLPYQPAVPAGRVDVHRHGRAAERRSVGADLDLVRRRGRS